MNAFLLDRAIIFRETEAQLRKQAEDIKQRVKAAPERIKAIEAELDRPLPAPEDVLAVAAKMPPDQLEQHLKNLEAELSDAANDLKKRTEQHETLPPDTDIDVLKTELRRLLIDRRELLKKLPAGCQRLFKTCGVLNSLSSRLRLKPRKKRSFWMSTCCGFAVPRVSAGSGLSCYW